MSRKSRNKYADNSRDRKLARFPPSVANVTLSGKIIKNKRFKQMDNKEIKQMILKRIQKKKFKVKCRVCGKFVLNTDVKQVKNNLCTCNDCIKKS